MSDGPNVDASRSDSAPAPSDREELAHIAQALRGYLEWHDLSGTVGFPRGPRPAREAAREVVTMGAEEATSPRMSEVSTPAPPPVAAQTLAPTLEPTFDPPATTKPVEAPAPPPPPRPLPTIAAEVASCVRCDLSNARTQTVFARGNPEASLCFIGEAPGTEEDASGRPFVGAAGQLLDRMIAAMGLDPERDTYICNVVKCRPPEDRKPTAEELEACRPHLEAQLAALRPRVIVALGTTAVAALFGNSLGIAKMRGQWKLYAGTTLVMPTYHPSALLQPGPTQKQAKRDAWEDLQAVMKELGPRGERP